MKTDELAFVNEQLAGMLRSGIPLEGALQQLCKTMRRGGLRTEFERLGGDLANGVPLAEALGRRQLPEFYVQMVRIGIAGNDLPGTLTMLADYYQQTYSIGTRLKGLMVYPVIVLAVSLLLCGGLTLMWTTLAREFLVGLSGETAGAGTAVVVLWVPFILLLLLSAVVVAGLTFRSIRRLLRWRLPAFRDASVARVAHALSVLLKGGCPLPEGIGFVRAMEEGTPVAGELALWQQRLASGGNAFAETAGQGKVFPAMFYWLVAGAGDDLAAGFQRAAEIYRARAVYRIEMLLYAALPVAILVLGAMIFSQFLSAFGFMVRVFLELTRY